VNFEISLFRNFGPI